MSKILTPERSENGVRERTCGTAFFGLAILLGALLLIGGCAKPPPKASPLPQRYTFWPEPPDLPHIQYLVSYNTSDDIAAEKSDAGLRSLIFGKERPDSVPITKPYGVAIWNGRIYVTDVRGVGVMVLDVKKHQARIMGATGAGEISKAVDICVGPDGTKYVADPNRGAVMVYDAEERFVRSIKIPDCVPVGVAATASELYVCDFKLFNVRVIDLASGKQIRTIGMQGGDDGQFVRPLGVCLDPSGNIVVTDLIRCRVQKFSPQGQLLLAWGEQGNRPGNFDKPKHLKVASDGICYVVDAAFNNVQMFDEQGGVMMFFGSAGTHPGAMNLPAGIAVSDADVESFAPFIHPAFEAERIIVVTNQFGPTRVSVYAMGHLRAGKTLDDIAPGRVQGETALSPSATQPVLAPIAPSSASQPATEPSTNP